MIYFPDMPHGLAILPPAKRDREKREEGYDLAEDFLQKCRGKPKLNGVGLRRGERKGGTGRPK